MWAMCTIPVPGLSLPPLVGQMCTHLVDEAGVRTKVLSELPSPHL